MKFTLFSFWVSFFACALMLISAASASAQCSDVLTLEDQTRGYKVERKKAETEKEKEEKKNKGENVYTHIFVTFDSPVQFKIALDSEHTSAFSKPNDYVTFTVLENVYGTGKIPQSSVDQNGNRTESVTKKRCVMVPKGTKIYGVVDYAQARYPFNIGGKAKLYVTIKTLKLEDGTVIPITFAEPPNQINNKEPFKKVIRDCKYYKGRKCIMGRRDKYSFPTGVIGDTTSTGLVLASDDNISGGVAIFSIIAALSKTTGIEGYINPSNAGLKAGMVFDAKVEGIDETHTLGAWVALGKPPAEEEKKDGKDEK